ncbi:MAG: hypothetical protein UT24_C0046G0005 [Candidatus Woesebacteria bacterium GW2011_GWB1_39_12]|uniref:Uncharacterized protein n=1 Tax=Candidatus Woesebacteria bacterium GW2011_GWB1_39_12 TaxID=1618574 RepID=A0A0G0M070_9BACT|nr:MAG: hypothetical protein UT24_C0046G0005 [Candidatus Woesebacteria bacterium GW2011_GWB1_39_12]
MKTLKLKHLIKEEWTDQGKGLSTEEKRSFLEAISKFNEFGKSIYRESNLKELAESIGKIVETASHITVSESEGTFDSVSVGRHMKSLNESMKLFGKTATEMSTLQQRLESCFGDIGTILDRYYDIHEIQESIDSIKESKIVKTKK